MIRKISRLKLRLIFTGKITETDMSRPPLKLAIASRRAVWISTSRSSTNVGSVTRTTLICISITIGADMDVLR
jgi:hypothetical protein